MIDFLKLFPFVTKEEYMWEWTIPQIRIAKNDFTHVNYLSEEEIKARKTKVVGKNGDSPLSDLGGMIF